ncbi:MAG TPA: MFS transporter [Pseudonocardiaceae bacterium]|nr:MFS transporter [Pseudonocardiaceae bacterium]
MTATEARHAAAGSPGGAPSDGALTHRQIMLVFSGLMLGMFLAALDQTIVATAIRTIADDLNGLDQQAWVTTAYLITATISTPLYGKLSDIHGRKPYFIAAITIFVVGSLACTFSTSMYMLAGFRAFQGLGAGGLMSLALAIIGDVVPPRERARYQGYFLAVFGTSSVLGPVVGGLLAGQAHILNIAGWRWVFLVNVPIGIIALAVVTKVLHIPHTRRSHRIDWWGAITITIGLVPLLIIAEQGQQWGWHSPRAWLCYGVGAGGLILFVLVEHLMRDDALIPLRLFRGGVFSITSSANLIIGMGMFGGLSVIPLYLQIVKGASPTKGGLLVLPLVLGIMMSSVLSGQLTARTGRYKVFPIVGTALMVGGLVLLNTINADTPLWRTDIWMFVFGFGLGGCMQTLVIAVQNAVPPQDMGVATASATFFRQMGGTVGTAVFLSILFSTVGKRIGDAFRSIAPTPAFQSALSDPSVAHNPNNAPVLNLVKHGVGAAGGSGSQVLQDSSFIKQLDPRLARPFLVGFSDAMHPVFLTAAAVVAVAFVLVLFMKEVPLRMQSGIQARMAEEAGPAADDSPTVADLPAVPTEADSLFEPERNGHHTANGAGDPTAGAALMASATENFVPFQADGPGVHGRVRRADGSGIAGAALTLIDTGGRQIGRNSSGVDGEFRLPVPEPGSYVLIASAGAHQPQATVVAVGGGPVAVDVVLTGTSSLTGVVSVAGKGTPVEAAMATLADTEGEVVGAQATGPDGRYLFDELVAGTYTLVVSADAYRPVALGVTVPGTGRTEQNVELTGGSRLHGVATVGEGRVVPDARITLLDRAGNVIGVTTTDDAGEYAFSDLPEGDYTVIASGYPPVASTLRVNGGEHGQHDVRLGHPES